MGAQTTNRPARRRATRNPERSRADILSAALTEFAAHGFAGARVDRIARHAAINKRMLYHYFGDKKGLFRAVLRRKMEQRRAWGVATPDDPRESLPYWFELAERDPEWIRLLQWEALQLGGQPLIDEPPRRASARDSVARVRRRQRAGYLPPGADAQLMLLAMVGLTWFPVAFPQLTRLITGRHPANKAFQGRYQAFLRQLAAVAFPGPAIQSHPSKS